MTQTNDPATNTERDAVQMHRLSCGLVVLCQPIRTVQSVAMSWLVPVGVSGDPEGAAGEGESTMLSELILRGSNGLSSRQFSDELDRLGVDSRSAAGSMHTVVGATMLGDHLERALPLFCGMLLRPSIEPDAVEAVRGLSIAALDALDDDPAHVAILNLGRRALPAPFGRHGLGYRAGLQRLTAPGLRDAWKRRCGPGPDGSPPRSFLGIAGAFDPQRILATLENQLTDWVGGGPDPQQTAPAQRGEIFHELPTSQTNIAVGFDAPKASDPDALAFRLAISILGGGPSSRLFSEVREKRGLCYSVGMTCSTGRDRGLAQAWAGSKPQRAQGTLECMLDEIARLGAGVGREEFDRSLVRVRSAMVMHGESTAALSAAHAGDTYRLGHPRTLSEVLAELAGISFEEFNQFLRGRFTNQWLATRTISIVGPQMLKAPATTA